MKPKQLIPPFKFGELWKVCIADRVWYVPDREGTEGSFEFPGWEHPDLFGNGNPVYVEYCSGNGSWVAEKAKAHPGVNWVAVEKQFKRARKIWSKMKNEKLQNLIVICGEGKRATRNYFPEGSVSRAFVNFPDPWPKRRHEKHRLIEPQFAEIVNRSLKPGAEVILVTDDSDYSGQMIETFSRTSGFESRYPEPYFTTECRNYGASYFETLWRQLGRTIRFHEFHKQ